MNVELLDHHGSDLLVVRAARVSFAKDTDWEYDFCDCCTEAKDKAELCDCSLGRYLSERDTKLINYLAREKHVLPFRHPQITLRCKAPIFIARQLGKHQVGLSWSEESRRYIDSEPEFFWPDKWRKRAENVKQGSSDEEVGCLLTSDGTPLTTVTPQVAAEEVLRMALTAYDGMLRSGVAPELARMVLPQNMYVNWVWTGSLLSFFEMYKLRSEGHAQKEAQDFAAMVRDVIAPLYPVSWAALEEHK